MAQFDSKAGTSTCNDEGKTNSNKEADLNCVDYGKDSKYKWYQFSFNASNVYFINIQLRAKPRSSLLGGGLFENDAWCKFGARRCTINDKPAKIIDIFDNGNPKLESTKKHKEMKYNNSELIILEQNATRYQLFYLNALSCWCLNDGNGIITNITRENKGIFKGK